MMSLKIDTGNETKFRSEKRKYGSLLIETSIRENKGIIDLRNPIHSVQQNTQNNTQNNTINNVHQNTAFSNNIYERNIPSNNTENSGSTLNIKDKTLRNSIDSTYSLTMKRGQKLSIDQQTQNLSNLIIGLEWNIKSSVNGVMDLDTSIFMVDINNKTSEENFIFYNNPKSRSGGILLSGDHNTSFRKAFDDTVQLNLPLIPSNIKTLAITVTIDDADIKNQKFGQISDAKLVLIDAKTKKEILNYNFNENLSIETAIVVAELYRHKNEWKINTIGSGFRGGLQSLCDNYGIETE